MKTEDKERLMQEVRAKGIKIDKVGDLMRVGIQHKNLIPIIVRYMQEADDEHDKDFLARCLGVRGFNEASRPLIQEFYKMKDNRRKWAVGNSLSIIKDKNSLPDLLKIVQEKEHETARQMIVNSLGSGAFKGDGVKETLINLLDDDDVVLNAIYALGKMRDPELIRYIEPLLTYEHPSRGKASNFDVRKEAKKAIEKLSRPPAPRNKNKV
jgi:HEAT repeat protein